MDHDGCRHEEHDRLYRELVAQRAVCLAISLLAGACGGLLASLLLLS
jgi:hypothetical protein